MKPESKKALTLGELVVSVSRACSRRKAKALLRFAINEHLVVFHRRHRQVIS